VSGPEANGIVGKRKRDAEEAELSEAEQRAKRFAKASAVDGDDGEHPIVLDEAESGAILIED